MPSQSWQVQYERFATFWDCNKEIASTRSARRLIGLRCENGLGVVIVAFGYRYTLKRQDNGWWLVRFPGIPEALTEGETKEEARANALDCVIAALEGYMKAGKPLPRAGVGHSG